MKFGILFAFIISLRRVFTAAEMPKKQPSVAKGEHEMEPIRIIDTQDSPVLVVQPGRARLEDVERHLIMATLRRSRYNRTKTARLLGIGIRTLQRKLKQYAEEKIDTFDLSTAVIGADGAAPTIAAVV